jgi:hypothetical protein
LTNIETAKLLNIISQDYNLIRRGNYFTTEEHDSLVIDAVKGRFYWNSKGCAGDVLDYLTNVKGYNSGEAIDIINNTSEEYQFEVYEALEVTPNVALVNIFYDYGKEYKDYWHGYRGYTDATIDFYKLGYTGKYWVIPIFYQGKFYNFQCRGMDSNGNKIVRPFYEGGDRVPFNFDNLPSDKNVPIFITESPVDAIMLSQYGNYAVSSILGAMSWDHEWSKKLFEYETIYICYDNDDAGRNGALRTSKYLQHNSHILIWPDGYPNKFDMTDLYKSGRALTEDWFLPSYIF